jgi:hypothetical protein
MRRFLRWLGFGLAGLLALLIIGLAVAASLIRLDRVVLPGEDAVLNRDRLPVEAAFDVLGRSVSSAEADAMQATPEGRAALSPAAGAIRVDGALVSAGRDIFYRETFGNEVFLSDILGILDGGLSPLGYASAIAALAGRGTTDLRVRLSRDLRVGDRIWRAGETVPTGLDVPKGEWLPLGIRLFYDRGAVRVGVTCALCHARVDAATGRVVEGAPNTDLNVGLLLALAGNPAAVWPQTGLQSLAEFQTRPDRFVRRSTEGTVLVPDPVPLAATIREMLGLWPRGSVDTTGDLVVNPTSIPTTFTREAWPYGWSGQAAIGPFRGLASLSNVVHGLGSDATALAPAAQTLFGVDPELYLATILQGAPDSAFRFEPGTGEKPSDIFAAADPTPGVPGVGRFVSMPGFLRANYVTSYGLLPVRPGEPVGYATAALAAFQDRLRPPDAVRPGSGGDRPPATRAVVDLGRRVFERAGCAACHSGPALTSHRVWPAEVIGTEPSRARAFAGLEANVAQPQIYATDTPVPVPTGARLVPVPIPDEGQLKLAWAHNRTQGGYKVPGLLGLAWSAPYLHDGGVAMGRDIEGAAGAAHPAEPRNSLRALVDRSLRAKVTAANEASPALTRARVTGAGHAFFVDREAGYTEAERDALVDYLLSLDRLQPEPAPDAVRDGSRR